MGFRASIIVVLILLAGCGRSGMHAPRSYEEAESMLLKDPGNALANFEIWAEMFREGKYDSVMAGARAKMQEYPRNEMLEAYALVVIAQSWLMQDNLDSVKHYMDLLEKYEGDRRLPGKWHIMYHNVAGIYASYASVDYPKALEHFKSALDYAEKAGDKYNQCIFLSNIVNLYTLRSDTLGMPYAESAYRMASEMGNDYLKGFSAATLATMCYLKNDYSRSMKYIDESLDLVRKSGNAALMSPTLNIKGDIYRGFGHADSALACYEQAMEYIESTDAASYIGLCHSYGNLLCDKGDYGKAAAVFEKGLDMSYGRKNMEGRVKLLLGLSRAQDGLGNKELALDYYKKYHIVQDSVLSQHNEREFNRLLMKYERQVYDSSLKEKDSQLAMAVMAAAAIGITCVSLYVLYKKKARMYRKLSASYRDYMIARDKLRMENAAGRELYKKISARSGDSELSIGQDTAAGNGLPYAGFPAGGMAVAEGTGIHDGFPSAAAESENPVPGHPVSNENDGSRQSKEREAKEKDLFYRIEDLMVNKKLYRASDISLEKICDILGTNRVYVSRAINKYAKASFYNYINSLRIDDAARILSDPEDDTPLKMLYADLGYNSASAFYRAFQKETGVPPSKFREQIRKIQNEEKEKIKSFS